MSGSTQRRIPSVAVSYAVAVWEMQPQTPAAATVGKLSLVDGRLDDDGSQPVPRTLTLNIGALPTWLKAGMWLQVTVTIRTGQPIVYRLPVLCITDVASTTDGAVVTASDPGEVVNGRPYEADTYLSGTLRALVGAACTLALSRTTDVTGVPDTAVPAGTLAEFGAGRWDVCLSTADMLGVALRFTDPGDVVGVLRSAAPPAPSAIVERAIADAGTVHRVRAPTASAVLVTRGTDTIGLIGTATAEPITGIPVPAWYRPYVVTDRLNGAPTATQAQANQLATDLLRARLSELDTYESMPILPAPWLEAGDVVTYRNLPYAVRAVSLDMPSLATTVTLRRIL